jgi:hypothetical protein
VAKVGGLPHLRLRRLGQLLQFGPHLGLGLVLVVILVDVLRDLVDDLAEGNQVGESFSAILRPGMFANARSWWGPQIRASDVVRWPYADAATAPIHEGDIAAVAVRALLEAGQLTRHCAQPCRKKGIRVGNGP